MTTPTIDKNDAVTPDMFRPKPGTAAEAEMISRPVLTYFQDALIRFRQNRIAMTALIILGLIFATGMIGPLFFPPVVSGISYENQQNPNSTLQPPTLGQILLVVEEGRFPEPLIDESFDYEAPPPESLEPPKNLQIIGRATVDGVTLAWDPIPGAIGYQVYRGTRSQVGDAELFAKDPSARALFLSRIDDPAQHSYTDAIGLDPSDSYVYIVMAIASDPETGEEVLSPTGATVETIITKTIKLSNARNLDPEAKVDDTLRGHASIFGTDALGRDVFARMVKGTQVNFFLALLIPTIAILVGLIYGAISGLVGGLVDTIMMRIVEILYMIPDLLLMILIQLALGKGIFSLIIAMSVLSWLSYARVFRGEVLRLREIEFVHASRLLGANTMRLVLRHISPNLLGLMLVMWSARIPGVIISEAFLSLLGLGLEPPAASWGMVLTEAGKQFQAHPEQFFLSAGVMAATLLSFFLVGDGLTDAFDPKQRGRG